MTPHKLLVLLLACGILAAPISAAAQPSKKLPRIGYLFTGLLPPKEFLEGLRALGYVEGQHIAIEYRGAAGKEERLPDLAAELTRLKVDVIVAPGWEAARAAKQATTTIPIIFMLGSDPVAAGLVASLARPDKNVTGITTLSQELTGKRLELLKETFPKVSRVAVLMRAANPAAAGQFKEMEAAARGLGVRLQSLEVRGANDFANAFHVATRQRVDALVELPHPLFHQNRKRIVEFVATSRLPSIFHSRDFVDAGGFMCYGETNTESLRRVVSYVDKILKGAKPADLPVEQPTKFELVINWKTAKALGLTIPQSVLLRADRVIE